MDKCLEKAQMATSGTAVFGTSELPSVFSLEVVQVFMSEVLLPEHRAGEPHLDKDCCRGLGSSLVLDISCVSFTALCSRPL